MELDDYAPAVCPSDCALCNDNLECIKCKVCMRHMWSRVQEGIAECKVSVRLWHVVGPDMRSK